MPSLLSSSFYELLRYDERKLVNGPLKYALVLAVYNYIVLLVLLALTAQSSIQ